MIQFSVMQLFGLIIWSAAISAILITIGFAMGRRSLVSIESFKKKLPKPSKPTPEPEGDLFNDAMRGKPLEEKVETVKK